MIEVRHLTKNYGTHAAVTDLSFLIEENGVYGFLGPNGAGKSTTMNIITGCLSLTKGSVKIDGYDIFEEAVKAKARIGYLPEIPPLYPDMTPKEYLFFVAGAKGIDKSLRSPAVERAMEETGIKTVCDRLIKNLSKGYRQRVGIAQALLGDPSVVILDEPTVGLDPLQIVEIRSLIKALGEKRTVLLSSHILSEVQAVCDKILIISKGRLVAFDTGENLEELFLGEKRLRITVKTDKETAEEILSAVDGIKEIKEEEKADKKTTLTLSAKKDTDIAEAVFFAFCDKRIPIIHMTETTPGLEDVFIELTAADKQASPSEKEKENNLSDTDKKEEEENESNIDA